MKPQMASGSVGIFMKENGGKTLGMATFNNSQPHIPSSKLTWQWKISIFNTEYIFNWSIFHCHVSLPEGTPYIEGIYWVYLLLKGSLH